MRVPTRVQPFVIFALSGFAALGCDLLLTRMRRRSSRALLLAGLIVLALVDCAPRPLRIWELVYLPPPPELRPVYHWLKSAEEVHSGGRATGLRATIGTLPTSTTPSTIAVPL